MTRTPHRQAYFSVRSRKNNRTTALLLTLCTTAVLTACSNDEPSADADTHSTPPSMPAATDRPSKSADPQAKDKQAALAAYAAYSDEEAKAYQKASAKGTDLEKYASLDALGKVELDLANMRKAGTVVQGELGHDPAVTQLAMTAEPPTATVKDCVDLSKYRMYDTKAKKTKPLPSEQPLKYILTAKVERWDGDRWMVTDTTPHGERTC